MAASIPTDSSTQNHIKSYQNQDLALLGLDLSHASILNRKIELKTSLSSLQPMTEIQCKVLWKLEHLMNQNPHKINMQNVRACYLLKTVRSKARSSSVLCFKLHGFLSLNQTQLFQSKSRIKGMRFMKFLGQKFRLLHGKKNRLT